MSLVATAVAGLRSRLARGQGRKVAPGPSGTPLRPLEIPTGWSFVQPDPTTCGSASLVMSRMLHDPAYAAYVTTGRDRFRSESLAMHHQTSAVAPGGRFQVPWPRALGTTPWAVARQMSSGSGAPGAAYRVDLVDPHDAGASYDRVIAAVRAGHPVPLFVGNGLAPRHVVLVTGTTRSAVTVYEPGSGEQRMCTRAAFVAGTLGLAGWDRPWCAVLPG